MGCSDADNDKTFPPASTLTVEGAAATTDPRILQAIDHASDSLKQAGVSRVRIMDWSFGEVDILPAGGTRADVNASLDAIKKELQDSGLDAREGPAFRCPGSPLEVQVPVPRRSEGQAR